MSIIIVNPSVRSIILQVLPVLGDADVRGASGHVDDHASDGGHGVGVVLEVRQHIHDGVTNLT